MFRSNMFDPRHPMLDMSPPNSFNTPRNGLIRPREEDDIETQSGGTGMETIDVPFTDEQQDSNQRPRKKGYHRHTVHQIQQMELFYRNCPHPDDKQRKDLGRELGLEPLQIKFWFQNKRTQMKTQSERQENTLLKAENEKLRGENMRYKEALGKTTCSTCAGGSSSLGETSYDDQLMKLENAGLKEELQRISGNMGKYTGRSTILSQNNNQMPRSFDFGAGNYGVDAIAVSDLLIRSSYPPILSEADKPIIVEIAVAAMEELVMLARAGHPLWVLSNNQTTDETLNEEEYIRAFHRGTGPKPFGVRSESSRCSAIVMMNAESLVDLFMNVNNWASFFCHIVTKASTLEVLSTGVAGNYNGALQVMQAEFQLPTPLVSTRDNYMVRYCKQHPDGIWAVVDASLDNLRPSTISRNRRRPSGVVIQPLPSGCSKITWIEHVEVDDRAVHSIFRPLVESGFSFGARRWAETLDRQCDRLVSSLANIIPLGDICGVADADGRRSILNLAEKMVKSYCAGVGASSAHTWSTVLGCSDIRVMTRQCVDEPGREPNFVLSAATSLWLPVPPSRIFDFLRDENTRHQWDILANGRLTEELVHITNGRNPGNYVSLFSNNNAETTNMLILQECCTDSTGSYVIYAPVDVSAMNIVLNGGDPNYVALLPSGFAILPDGPPRLNNNGMILEIGGGGSLLTAAFQILVDSTTDAKLTLTSVATVRDLIKSTIERINGAVMGDMP